MNTVITRTFAHRTFGDIGTATFEATCSGSLNGKELPEGSIVYLLNFALQSLQDSYAGAKSADEAKGNFAKKLDAIVNGTLGQRSSGGGVSEFTKVARSIVKTLLKAKGKETKDIADETLDAVYAKNEEVLKPKVEAEVKRREAERKAKAKLGSEVEIDLGDI